MKKFIISIIFCLISSPLFASEITEDYIDIAKNYLNRENNHKAQEYVDLVLLLDPTNRKALSFKKLTEPNIKIINKNIVEVKESVIYDNNQDNAAKYNNQGVEFYNNDDIKKAIKCFKKAILSKKRNSIAYYNLALCYKSQGKILLAECNFRLSYLKNKCFSKGLVGLANLKLDDEKIKYLNIAATQKNYQAYYYLGEYYFENKKYNLALRNYNEALLLEPNLADAYLKSALCSYEIEDYDLAGINFKNYIKYFPNNDFAYFMLAKSYDYTGYKLNAIKELNKAISINRKDEYLYELAKICYLEQNLDISTYILKNLIKNNPQNANYYNLLGLCYFEEENLSQAKENFQKALKNNSLSAAIYFNLSRCDKQNGKSYLDKAKQIIPQTAEQYIDLAMFYYKISDNNTALKTINDAINLYGNTTKSVYKTKIKLCKLTDNFTEYTKTKAELALKYGVK